MTDPSTSIIPSSLHYIARSHPYSTAFILGSTLTLTFISGALVTKKFFSALLRQGARSVPVTAPIPTLNQRVAERLVRENLEMWKELDGIKRTIRAGTIIKVEGGRSDLKMSSSSQDIPQVALVTPSDATKYGISSETSPSPKSKPTESTIGPLPNPQDRQPDRLISIAPPAPSIKISDIPPTQRSMSVTTDRPRQNPASPPRRTPSPVHTPGPPQLADNPARPSILAFYGLRNGIGKLRPMPIVDTSNPNYITFPEEPKSKNVTKD